ncbi:type II toxin-antitoxin system RelE/ParE family toxin [Candidatus Kapabacteria bacterium]|nr:type II toxin-antitoxin system RelE/ParE family toxin [Candidatus Kapabacteria bacterium]
MYNVKFTKSAVKDYQKLDNSIKVKIKEKLSIFKAAPLKYSKKLKNIAIGQYRFRVGDYRIIFDISENNLFVLRLGHRKDIYK